MRPRIAAGMLVLGMLALGNPAGAEEPACRLIAGQDTPEDATDDVEVCRLDTWIHGGGTKLDNVSGTGQSSIPTWDTEAPTGSYEEGAGSAYATVRVAEIAMPEDGRFMPTFAGTYTGRLDNLAMTLYVATPVYQAAGIPWSSNVVLTVDGERLVDRTSIDSAEVELPITPVTDQYGYVRLAFTNLNKTLDAIGLENEPTSEHTIEVRIINRYWGDGWGIVLYDAVEFPSGSIFNEEPNKLGPYTKIDTFFEIS